MGFEMNKQGRIGSVGTLVGGLMLALTSYSPVIGAADDKAAVEGFVTVPAEDIAFIDVPGLTGLAGALIIGNPDQAGPYVMRVRFSAGVTTPPHTHDRDRTVTVISGVWHFGTDATGACENTIPLQAGSVAVHPAGKIHFDGACGDEAIVQISGMGPVKTDWLSQAP